MTKLELPTDRALRASVVLSKNQDGQLRQTIHFINSNPEDNPRYRSVYRTLHAELSVSKHGVRLEYKIPVKGEFTQQAINDIADDIGDEISNITGLICSDPQALDKFNSQRNKF